MITALQQLKKQLLRFIGLSVITLAGLTGCATNPASQIGQPQMSAQSYLEMAHTADYPEKADYNLQAATIFLNKHQRQQALSILKSMDTNKLTDLQRTSYDILAARQAFASKRYATTLKLATPLLTNTTITPTQQTQLFTISAKANAARGNISTALSLYSHLIQLNQNNQTQLPILLNIWQLLQDSSSTALKQIKSQSTTAPNDRAWIELALINRSYNDPSQLQQALQTWQQQNPNHPAQILLKQNNGDIILSIPKHIALMLPLSGPLKQQGEAISNAFYATFFQYKKTNARSIRISVFDTNKQPIATLYQQAINEGCDFIVGPLTKQHVSDLAALGPFNIPVLVLNSIADLSSTTNFYQFGLSPLDEASQIAAQAWQQGNNPNAAVFTPSTTWGQNIEQNFQQNWLSNDGNIIQSVRYQKRAQLAQQIQNLLQVSQSNIRHRTLEQLLGKKIRTIPRIRKDINMFFVVADTTSARQILPLIKFYYAGNIPTYAISNIYSGIPGTTADTDLNGVIFCDMPFVLLNHFPTLFPYAKLKRQLSQLYPKNYKNNIKLYALGIDAFNLTQNLPRLTMMPIFGLYGATGQLYLNSNHHIYRRLLWAQMHNAKPRLLMNS